MFDISDEYLYIFVVNKAMRIMFFIHEILENVIEFTKKKVK